MYWCKVTHNSRTPWCGSAFAYLLTRRMYEWNSRLLLQSQFHFNLWLFCVFSRSQNWVEFYCSFRPTMNWQTVQFVLGETVFYSVEMKPQQCEHFSPGENPQKNSAHLSHSLKRCQVEIHFDFTYFFYVSLKGWILWKFLSDFSWNFFSEIYSKIEMIFWRIFIKKILRCLLQKFLRNLYWNKMLQIFLRNLKILINCNVITITCVLRFFLHSDIF